MNSLFVQWLAKGLKKPGKTQAELAKHLGIHQTQISKILKETRSIKLDELPAMAEYIGEALPIFERGFGEFLKDKDHSEEMAKLCADRGEIDQGILEISYKEAAKIQELLLGGPGSSESLIATAAAIYRAKLSLRLNQD